MATNISNYFGDQLLNWLIGTSFAAAPSHCYVSLWNGDPDSGGTEITGANGLTRQDAHTPFGSVSGHALTLGTTLTFGTVTGTPSPITYVALHDASAAGNLLSRVLISSISLSAGNVVEILANNMVVNHSGNAVSNYVGDQLLNWLIGTNFGAAPATIYASLWNGDPDAGGNEQTGDAALVRVAATTPLGSVTSHQLVTGSAINFGTANGPTNATITYLATHDSITVGAGNLLTRSTVTSVTTANGQVIQVLSAGLTIAH